MRGVLGKVGLVVFTLNSHGIRGRFGFSRFVLVCLLTANYLGFREFSISVQPLPAFVE